MTATTPFLKGSPAPRYWNMARQRYCRRLARYRNTRSVSADPGAKPAAHTRAESRGFGPSKVDAAERQTLCWREQDSNHRFRGGKGPTLRVSALFRSDFSVGGNQPEATRKIGRVTRDRWFESCSLPRTRRNHVISGCCSPSGLANSAPGCQRNSAVNSPDSLSSSNIFMSMPAHGVGFHGRSSTFT